MSRGHGGPPRRKPPWWPDDEPWPPQRPPWAVASGRWPRRARIGCLGLVFGIVAASFALSVMYPGGVPVVASFLFVAFLSIVVALLFAAVATGIWRSGRWPRTDADAVDELVAAAARIQDGDYSARVPETGSAEQRLLARSFNQMSAQLGDSDVRRRSFMADVSHELRTPLSVIQGQLEAIRDGVYPADAAHIAPALEQVRTLEWLVEDLRTLALSDSGTLRLARQPTDLAALVTGGDRRFPARCGRGGHPPRGRRVAGDAARPDRCGAHRERHPQPGRQRAPAHAPGRQRDRERGARRTEAGDGQRD